MFTRNRESCRMGHRPSSSDHGAHNSHPNAYKTKKIIAPHLAACSEMSNLICGLVCLVFRSRGDGAHLLVGYVLEIVRVQTRVEIHRDLDRENNR